MLARHYGKALMFYGETAGSYWPSRSDLVLDEASGKDVPDARQRLDTVIRSESPEYFVVTDLDALAAETELQDALDDYTVLADTDSYRIYDLRGAPVQ